jgi:transcriptional regulator with XRE-family HTH domain
MSSRGRPLGEIDGKWPNRLRELRDRFHLSQQDIADALGISYVQVGRIERGRSKLKDEYIPRLMDIMPVQPWDFLVDGPEKRIQAALEISQRLTLHNFNAWIQLGRSLAEEATEFEAAAQRKKQ